MKFTTVFCFRDHFCVHYNFKFNFRFLRFMTGLYVLWWAKLQNETDGYFLPDKISKKTNNKKQGNFRPRLQFFSNKHNFSFFETASGIKSRQFYLTKRLYTNRYWVILRPLGTLCRKLNMWISEICILCVTKKNNTF